MKFRIALLLLALTSFAAAETLQGTVTNGTSSKPAANAEVTLLSLANGMSETAHTRTDAGGHFRVDFSDAGMPHLVRVTHQDVNYFKMAPPGRNNVEVEVFDAARKLDGISTTVQIMRLQSDGSTLQVLEFYAVQNSSQPQRTLMPDHSFEIALPDGAALDEASARAPNGQPIAATPNAVAGKKDHYAFDFPLRPGETQFQIAYHLPYSGQAPMKRVLLHNVQHFVAMTPKTMQFSPATAGFTPVAEDPAANVQVLNHPKAGQQVAFTVSGTGVLADEDAQGGAEAGDASAGGMGGQPAGPGGGLGKPIDSPDPLTHFRWPLLGTMAALLALGGFYIVQRDKPRTAQALAAAAPAPVAGPQSHKPAAPAASHSSALLEAMKEELFQLEVERQQGRISEADYAQAKAALDQTIKRALARAQQ